MLTDNLLIGQYYSAKSLVHGLNAKSKIIASMLYMIALFVVDSFIGYGFLSLVFISTLLLSRIPILVLLKGLKMIFFFCVLTWVLNAFFQPGQIIWQWQFLKLTVEGLIHGAAMALRLLLLVAFASLLTLTTTPLALTDGLEELLNPLRRFKVPAHEIAMIMSIALRFIPTILDEFERIILAQRARGANLSQGNILQRVKALLPLLVPLFVSAFRRADDLAQAMEAKCYRGGIGRTRFKLIPWQKQDSLYLGSFIVSLLAAIVLRIWF